MFEAAGPAIDIFFIGNDFGSQTGPLLGVDLFEHFALPSLKRLIDLGHRFGKKVMMHCCGGFRPLFPSLIGAGSGRRACAAAVLRRHGARRPEEGLRRPDPPQRRYRLAPRADRRDAAVRAPSRPALSWTSCHRAADTWPGRATTTSSRRLRWRTCWPCSTPSRRTKCHGVPWPGGPDMLHDPGSYSPPQKIREIRLGQEEKDTLRSAGRGARRRGGPARAHARRRACGGS